MHESNHASHDRNTDSSAPVASLQSIQTLHRHIAEAGADQPTLSMFVKRLDLAGVRFIPTLDHNGEVVKVAFGLGDQVIPGSDLGRDFTWNGLQRRFGIRHDFPECKALLKELAGLAVAKAAAGGQMRIGRPVADEESNMMDELEKLRLRDTERLSAEFARMRNEAIWGLTQEFKKHQQEVPERFAAALQPLEKKIEAIYVKTSETLTKIQNERKASDRGAEKATSLAAEKMTDTVQRIAGVTQKAVDEAQRIVQAVDEAATRIRREAFWMAVIAAFVAAASASLATAWWVGQQTQRELERLRAELVAPDSPGRSQAAAPKSSPNTADKTGGPARPPRNIYDDPVFKKPASPPPVPETGPGAPRAAGRQAAAGASPAPDPAAVSPGAERKAREETR